MENFIISIYKMKILKKLWLLLIWFSIVSCFNFNPVNAEIWNGQAMWRNRPDDSTPVVSWNNVENNSISQWSNIFGDLLKGIIHVPQSDEYTTSLWYVIALIQTAINRLLGILAFIALIYMIYNWFLVFTSGSDDKNASKGKKWIWTAAIALAWIWLSRLVISLILWFINNIASS